MIMMSFYFSRNNIDYTNLIFMQLEQSDSHKAVIEAEDAINHQS
jgi:hypothetical protein